MIEAIIDGYLEWLINNINSVDELIYSLCEYFNDDKYNPEINLNSIINYYIIDDLNELDDLLINYYVSNIVLNSKTEFITSIIHLVLPNKSIESCGVFDSDEFLDDEE
ncbi:hypothetical protein M9Y10_024544 [Tritrichomonas musculus]|uniref:Uncharacterized protein n=1 Tax=Tritrichomonas musculus TaxID=1915356 RepID=A0ABR2HCA7_9EUKA